MARIVNARIAKSRSESPANRKGTPPPSSRRGKSPDHIPRPPNAFILFRKELNARSVESGEAHQKSVSSVACALWHKLKDTDPGQLERFFKQADELKAAHKKQYPNYIYRPRKRLTEKKRRMCRTSAEEEEVRKQKVLNAHIKATGSSPIDAGDLDDYDADTASVAPVKRSRPKRAQKPRGKLAQLSEDELPPQTPARASSASETATSYFPDSPEGFEVPTLVSTPASSPASPIVATPFVGTSPLCDLPGLSMPLGLEGLLPMPADFEPSFNGALSLNTEYGANVDPNLVAMQWNTFNAQADNFAAQTLLAPVHLSRPLIFDLQCEAGLKPYSQDHFLNTGCDVVDQDMSQFLYNMNVDGGQVPLY